MFVLENSRRDLVEAAFRSEVNINQTGFMQGPRLQGKGTIVKQQRRSKNRRPIWQKTLVLDTAVVVAGDYRCSQVGDGFGVSTVPSCLKAGVRYTLRNTMARARTMTVFR